MSNPKIKYYPVDNGDTSLITLSDETRILIDSNITEDSIDENEEERFDVLKDLLENELKKSNKIPFVDVFILTHPDNDHCRGFEKYFYQGDPSDYSNKDRESQKIIIKELWYTPRVFETYTRDLNSDAKHFKKEAKRRMDLYKEDPESANTDGNRIRIIGYTDNKDLKGLEARISVPGNVIKVFNENSKNDFSMFIHAPFKDTIDGDDVNETSIVFQAKFDVGNVTNVCLALWGGDAGWRVWQNILEKSKDENLKWDLFLAPHHCSWLFFNDTSEEGKKSPQDSSLEILNKKIGKSSKIIVSSKRIKNDGDPPSIKAKNQYINKVGETNFHVTASDSDTKPPEPIEFIISSSGHSKSTHKAKVAISSAGGLGAPNTVVKTGNNEIQ